MSKHARDRFEARARAAARAADRSVRVVVELPDDLQFTEPERLAGHAAYERYRTGGRPLTETEWAQEREYGRVAHRRQKATRAARAVIGEES